MPPLSVHAVHAVSALRLRQVGDLPQAARFQLLARVQPGIYRLGDEGAHHGRAVAAHEHDVRPVELLRQRPSAPDDWACSRKDDTSDVPSGARTSSSSRPPFASITAVAPRMSEAPSA